MEPDTQAASGAGNSSGNSDDASPKQRVYREMLFWTLPILRNICTYPWWQRLRYGSMFRFETELIHNLPVHMFEPAFTEGDLHFLNGIARYYHDQCSASLSPLYPANLAHIRALFALVPQEMRAGLAWTGPATVPRD
jgi:hypothetical protein